MATPKFTMKAVDLVQQLAELKIDKRLDAR